MAQVAYEERDRLLQLLADQLHMRLADLVASLPDPLPDQLVDEIAQQVALLADPYAAAAGELSADWYESADPASSYRASPAPLPSPETLRASTRWGVAPLLAGSAATALDRLSASSARWVRDSARQTTALNTQEEPGARWVRVARANACAFCRMAATRTFESPNSIYYTSKSALTVVRGRGARKLGERYHDHCRCLAVEVRPGQEYRPPQHARSWLDEYSAARKKAEDQGWPLTAQGVAKAWRELYGAR